jgi:hypothetical protein
MDEFRIVLLRLYTESCDCTLLNHTNEVENEKFLRESPIK